MGRSGRWSRRVGGYGHRVEVYERSPGRICLRWWNPKERQMKRVALGHGDRDLAEQQARRVAGDLLAGTLAAKTGRLTVADLFARYAAVTEQRGPVQAAEARRRMDLWRAVLSPERDVKTLDTSIVDEFVRNRRAGAVRVPGRDLAPKVGETTIGADVIFLQRALGWATKTRLADGTPLLAENPIRGYKPPATSFPRRPVATYERFQALIAVADDVDPQHLFRPFLGLVEGLGWRVSALCHLRAADVDRAKRPNAPWGRLRKRAEHDKMRVERWIPVNEAVRRALDRAAKESGAVGEAWLFPSPRNPQRPWTRWHARDLLDRAEDLAGLEHMEHGGFHAFRRKWAVERKDLPLADVMAVGGWSDRDTLLTCYQVADEATLLAVAMEPRKLREKKVRGRR